MSRPITKPQIRAIKARQSRMGIEDHDYRTMLRGRYGVDSCTDLTAAQAHDLLDHLYGGAKPKRRQRIRHAAKTPPAEAAADNVVRLPSAPQTRLIGALQNEIEWESADGYRRWLKRSLGLDRVRSSADARRVIDGLKGLKRHGHGRAAGAG